MLVEIDHLITVIAWARKQGVSPKYVRVKLIPNGRVDVVKIGGIMFIDSSKFQYKRVTDRERDYDANGRQINVKAFFERYHEQYGKYGHKFSKRNGGRKKIVRKGTGVVKKNKIKTSYV